MRKQDERENRIQGKAQLRQKAARKRTRTAAVCIFFLIPLTIAGGLWAGSRWYLPVSLLVLAETMAPFFLGPEAAGICLSACWCWRRPWRPFS